MDETKVAWLASDPALIDFGLLRLTSCSGVHGSECTVFGPMVLVCGEMEEEQKRTSPLKVC